METASPEDGGKHTKSEVIRQCLLTDGTIPKRRLC